MEKNQIQPNIPGVKRCQDGRYKIDFVKLINGQRVHIYSTGYLSIDEALKAMPKLIELKTNYHYQKSALKMSLKDYLIKYKDYRLLHVRHSSVQFAFSVYHNYLKDYISKDIDEIFNGKVINEVYQTILHKSACAAWKNRAFGALRQLISCAFKWKLINADSYQESTSILENIPENRGAKNEKVIWSKQEKNLFLDVIKDNDDKVMFQLFCALGARIGEFMALTWDCFDTRRNVIIIKQQLIYANKGKWILTNQLKSQESYRECKLSSKIAEMLKEYKKSSSGTGFIFVSKENEGYPMSKASFRKKFYHYTSLAGIKRVTPHAIRHQKATELMRVCKNMQEVKAAARYLGHSATMMVDTYGHSEKNATEAILKRLEKDDE